MKRLDGRAAKPRSQDSVIGSPPTSAPVALTTRSECPPPAVASAPSPTVSATTSSTRTPRFMGFLHPSPMVVPTGSHRREAGSLGYQAHRIRRGLAIDVGDLHVANGAGIELKRAQQLPLPAARLLV